MWLLQHFYCIMFFDIIFWNITGNCTVLFQRKLSSNGVQLQKRLLSSANISTNTETRLLAKYQLNILMIADYSVYQKFYILSTNNSTIATINTNKYLHAIFEQVRAIFEWNPINKSDGISLNFVDSIVTTVPEDCPLIEALQDSFNNVTELPTIIRNAVDALFALDLIHKWIKANYDSIPAHDYAIVLTMHDLLSVNKNSGTQGLAYVATMCRNLGSASVVEDVGGMATAIIAAHELVHSLGAFHDGKESDDKCLARTNNLMAPLMIGSDNETILSNSFKLSPCSLEQIFSYITQYGFPISSAYRGIRTRRRMKDQSPDRKSQLPGQEFNVEQQCQIAFGPNYGFCNHKEYYEDRNPCGRLWCQNRLLDEDSDCETKVYLPLLDGTTCGTAQWCKAGRCLVSGGEKIMSDKTVQHNMLAILIKGFGISRLHWASIKLFLYINRIPVIGKEVFRPPKYQSM